MPSFTADSKFAIYSSGSISYPLDDGDKDFQEFDDIDGQLLGLSELDQYGSDRSIGDMMCYEASTRAVTLSEIKMVLDSITRHKMHFDQGPNHYVSEGWIYDSDDEGYTEFSDLDEDFQETLVISGGEYQEEFSSKWGGTAYQHFVSVGNLSAEWIKYLTQIIEWITSCYEGDLTEDDD